VPAGPAPAGRQPDPIEAAAKSEAEAAEPQAPPAALPPTPAGGLTQAEVLKRRAAGQGNNVTVAGGRTYKQLLRENVFNFINNVLFTLGIVLVALGHYLDALVTVGVVVANTVVSLIQEVKAKHTLDRIAILTRPKATVIRENQRFEVAPTEIVLGDLLVLDPGDQIVVDGTMIGDGFMEVDESLLTGESDLVDKRVGDELLSGSFCVTGSGVYQTTKVGMESFANRITAGAQATRRMLTPLQKQVNLIVRSLLALVIFYEVMLVITAVVEKLTLVESVRRSTVIVALVPNGLILAIALAYALGAVRMAGKGALIQQANAVESISNVDVLCTDKTGTLTTGNITVNELKPLAGAEADVKRTLGAYAASTTGTNRTGEALIAAYGGMKHVIASEALFSSERKWSGLVFDDADLPGTYVLGAPEVLAPALADGEALEPQIAEWTGAGLRVLLLAHSAQPARFAGSADGGPQLPQGLAAVALVSLRDELRPKVQETLQKFHETGIELKIISGDNPQTVAALAVQAGLQGHVHVVSGPELEEMSEPVFARTAERATVFGRVTPHQKEKLVQALRGNGHYVAMIGDGVNDVISLKGADVGIAMQGGSQAARGVADMVLLGDSFAALPFAFREGQRILNGMSDILRIFMVRIFSKAILIATAPIIGGFPFAPRQTSLLSFVAAGVPALALAAWARPGETHKGNLFAPLARFVIPPTVLLSLMGLFLYVGYLVPSQRSYERAHPGVSVMEAINHALPHTQTVLVVFAAFCSLLLLPLIVPPTQWWVAGAKLRKDWRPTILGVGLLALFLWVMATRSGRHLFELTALQVSDYAIIGVAAFVWLLAVRWMWQIDLLGRFLGIRTQEPAEG
jgi:cation-transporting ATPase E